MSLERRTPLRRTGIRRHRRTGDALIRARIREAVFDRDSRVCVLTHRPELLGPCHGAPLTPHHLHKASQGGAYSMENLVTLCSGHNDGVEDHPVLAHSYGLVVRAGETTALAWDRMRDWGLA